MYPVICWRKNKNGNFEEFKLLSEEKPYIKNAINIIHLPNNEFAFTSHSWPSIKFYKYDENINDNYTLIKDIRLNCSSNKNTIALYKNEIILVGLQYGEICLLSCKYKEIISKINGINMQYIFIRNNEDIIIRENFDEFPNMNIYRIENGELALKGVLNSKLQIYIDQIYENEIEELFIKGYENNFNPYENINNCKIYTLNK